MMAVSRSFSALSLILCCSITLNGCYTAATKQAILDFDKAVEQSAGGLQKYYGAVNDLARQSYFDSLRFKSSEPMGQKDSVTFAGGKLTYDTGLVSYFNPRDVQVRINALAMLAKYSQGLAALASSDAPQRTRQSIEELGATIDQMGGHIQTLIGDDTASPIAGYGAPIGRIAGFCAEQWLEHKRKATLVETIDHNADDVEAVFKLLEKDVDSINQVYANNAKNTLMFYATYYNGTFVDKDTSPVDDKRLRILKEAQVAATNVAKIGDADPKPLVMSMHKSHELLVKCVKENKCPNTELYMELIGNLQVFVAQAKRMAAAVEEIERIAKK